MINDNFASTALKINQLYKEDLIVFLWFFLLLQINKNKKLLKNLITKYFNIYYKSTMPNSISLYIHIEYVVIYIEK